MKKCKFTCDACGITKEVDYYSYKRRKTNFCLKCYSVNVQTGIRKNVNKERSYISSDGYRMVKMVGEYDSRGRQIYKREHILIIENQIGRKIQTQRGGMGEQVHHVDGDKLNNNADNLLLCKDTKHHKDIDCQLHELAFELVRNGIIAFSKETEKYEIQWDKLKTQ